MKEEGQDSPFFPALSEDFDGREQAKKTALPMLFPGQKEEENRKKNHRYSGVFRMEEVACIPQGKTKEVELWRFFQVMIDQEYVVSCCLRR